MKNPDNHVSVSTDMILSIAEILEAWDEDHKYPDRVTIQQNSIGDMGEFNLSYKLESRDES